MLRNDTLAPCGSLVHNRLFADALVQTVGMPKKHKHQSKQSKIAKAKSSVFEVSWSAVILLAVVIHQMARVRYFTA